MSKNNFLNEVTTIKLPSTNVTSEQDPHGRENPKGTHRKMEQETKITMDNNDNIVIQRETTITMENNDSIDIQHSTAITMDTTTTQTSNKKQQ